LLRGWGSQSAQKNARASSSSIRIINDAEVASPVVTVESNDCFDKTFIMFPDHNSKFIGTPFPILVLQIKNMNKFTGFEVNVSDENKRQRVFVSTNKQSLARLVGDQCSLPLVLQKGWNIIPIDLAALCQRVFNVKYKYCNRIRIFSNCRVRRIYFSKELYQENEVPEEYKIYGLRNPLLIHHGIVQPHC